MFWCIMEFRTLVFIGLCYSSFKNLFSILLIFFIIQSYSAFILLIFFSLNIPIGFTFAILLKLSMFPFYFWYLRVIPFFSNFMFFFSSTFFKVPSILIVHNFFSLLDNKIIVISVIITIFVGALVIIKANDLRLVLISSSVVNNSWFLIAQFQRLFIFFSYFIFYFTALLLIIIIIGSKSSTNSLNSPTYSNVLPITLLLLTLAGLPPFPLFFPKMLVVYYFTVNAASVLYIIFIILVSILTLIGYLKHVFRVLMFNYSNNIVFCMSL